MGFTVKIEKCSFLQKSVKYLGFIINKEGLSPDPNKLAAITEAPTPQNVTQLKSFLGMLNYYGKFIPNLSLILQPLHCLLRKGADWVWESECREAFSAAKRALTCDKVLAHYEEGREVIVSVDSSAYGVGAVLAHRYEDSSERPISCVSRTLNSAERNYSQLDKEALAIFFGITKHHQYLYGRSFILRTDHQPLYHIFGKKGGIPQTAASRLQRWAVRLAAYDFTVEFVRSCANGPADALSRLPLPGERMLTEACSYVEVVKDSFPVNYKEIAAETYKDRLLCKIKGYVLFGWPLNCNNEEEKAYFARKDEIVQDLGCLLYKYRLIVPPSLRARVLEEIHQGHLGVNKMKNLSRHYVYWPEIDRDIEKICRSCKACRVVLDAPPRATLHPWEFPSRPWQRVHADFAECGGIKYLIVVDAHSKWMEVTAMKRTDAESTVAILRSLFARFGLPSQLVTDNGPPFSSLDFQNYCKKNCIQHVTSAPYRPQGNGAAENAVKTIKKAIKRAIYEGENVSQALSKFLFQYRNVEHSTTGVAPAVALLGRRLRGRLDALRPDVAAQVRNVQQRQVMYKGGQDRHLESGEPVLVRSYSSQSPKWVAGNVTEKTGPVSYRVKVGDGVEWRRHQDQLITLKNSSRKSRFSLSRQKLENPMMNDNNQGGHVADVTSPEVTGEECGAGTEGLGGPNPESLGADTSAIISVQSPTPPPAGASDRAVRAYNRAKRLERDLST